MLYNAFDVFLEQALRFLAPPFARGEPLRKLAVPRQRMAAHLHTVRLRERHQRVCPCEVEHVARGSEPLELHVVLGRQHTELAAQHSSVARPGFAPLPEAAVRRRTKRQPARVSQCAQSWRRSVA